MSVKYLQFLCTKQYIMMASLDSQKNTLSGPDSVDFNTGIGLVPMMFYNLQKATNDIFQIDIDTEEIITYEQLWDKTIRVASALQSLGSCSGKVLIIIGENNLEVYSVFFAGLFTGATVGCMNHTLKAGEIKQLLSTLKPDFIFCSKESFHETKLALKGGIESKPITIVPNGTDPYLDYYSLLTYDSNAFHFPTIPSWNEHISFILFSSGTTGLPKGVKTKPKNIEYIQRVIPNYLKFRMIQFPVCTGSSILFLTSVAKDMGTYLYGGKTNATILKALRKNKQPIFWFNSPTNLLKLAQEPGISHEDFSSVETMFCSGAGLTGEQITFLNKKLFNNRIGIICTYNSIETLPITTFPKGTDLVNFPKRDSVGILQPLVHLKIVDKESGQNLGPACEGEIFVKSPFIMDGYVNLPEETAEVLDADGWYNTGDVGYYDEDGYIYITGRTKEIFKCMNRQVSPMQLEAIIQEHPAVFNSAVVGKPHPIDGCHPTAFVVLKKTSPPIDASEIISFVNDQVASYRKLYGGVYFVDEIPTNLSGKKLRSKLLKTLL